LQESQIETATISLKYTKFKRQRILSRFLAFYKKVKNVFAWVIH